MAFLKVEIELEWLGLASICAFLIYIIYRKQRRVLKLSKAKRLPDPPKLSRDQFCVQDECVKISDYFQRFYEKLDDAFHKLCVSNFVDVQSLSRFRDHCKTISGLIDEYQSELFNLL